MVIAASSRGVMHTANTARGLPVWIADLWAGSWFYPIAGMYREGAAVVLSAPRDLGDMVTATKLARQVGRQAFG